MSDSELATFSRLCRIIALRSTGRGITLPQLGDAAAVARELAEEEPDRERVAELCARLGVEIEELEP